MSCAQRGVTVKKNYLNKQKTKGGNTKEGEI